MGLFDDFDEKLIKNSADLRFVLDENIRRDPHFLRHYGNSEGRQVTVLGSLISQHQDGVADEPNDSDLFNTIMYVLERSENKMIGTPLHQALAEKKLALSCAILAALVKPEHGKSEADSRDDMADCSYDFNARDINGQTLLSLALETRDEDLIEDICNQVSLVNEVSVINGVEVPPVYQAIQLNLPKAVRVLIDKGAQLDHSFGAEKETVVILAAKLGLLAVLDELFSDIQRLDLDASNGQNKTALAVACDALKTTKVDSEKGRYIHTIAMLICQGASIPEDHAYEQLLDKHRDQLLKAMGNYLKGKPELVESVVNRIHDKNNTLHDIIYLKNPTPIFPINFKIFGAPQQTLNGVSRTVEGWLTEMKSSENDQGQMNGQDSDRSKLWFANFVEQYFTSIEEKNNRNPWSPMYRALESGKITSEEQVRAHARSHSVNHRTHEIVEKVDQIMGHQPFDSVPSAQLGL